MKKIMTVLLGDFNGDPYRNRYSFDKRLILFIANNNLL
jgi:endonuclease/exonuclease/phosphatase family metal-dependent hydrolase